MKRIELSGGKAFALVDDEDYRMLSKHKWHTNIKPHTTYARSTVRISDNKQKTIYMHRMVMGLMDAPSDICIDHMDGDGLNNRRNNLRITDNSGNQQNLRKRSPQNWTSIYKGVHYKNHNKSKPWVSQITIPKQMINGIRPKGRGKIKWLGSYQTQQEAALAYNNAAIEHFGEHAHLNVIGP